MLASLFVNFFSGATPASTGGGYEDKRRVPRWIVSTRKLRKVYARLTRDGAPKAAQARALAAEFIETVPFEPIEDEVAEALPNFALMAQDEIAVERLLALMQEQEEEEAFFVMLGMA
jgi:hypothetical protein